MRITLFSFLLILCQTTVAQRLWLEEPAEALGYDHFSFSLSLDQIKSTLEEAPIEFAESKGQTLSIVLPSPEGAPLELIVEASPIMAEGLASRFPEIRTFKAHSADGNYVGRIDYTSKGFHALLFSPKGTIYIDPNDGAQTYRAYYRDDYMKAIGDKGHRCEVEDEAIQNLSPASREEQKSGDKLRTYRLALACTMEYSQFHGNTISGVLSAMVTSMNRVNAIYERDFSIRLVLIGNNDELIFLNGGSDPYSNNNGGAMLNQNQTTIDNIIGTNNYDIGHVFSTGGGGIASFQSVCSSSQKARGVTGSPAPVGDPFDVDYVAHEMGHQFGGSHTFNNSCGGNRVATAAFEPGSASTIMGYAGICPPNLQNNSDDYFHTYNYSQVVQFAHNGSGNSCASITNTGNNPPSVSVPSSGFFIPKETPFVLEGSATDPNGDNLRYCWEQMNLGPSGSPTAPTGNAPIFRSWDPTAENFRIFPRLLNIVLGFNVTGETYATYSRDMDFRLTVRDQNSAGGGIDFETVSFKVEGNAGPFVVTGPIFGDQVEGGNFYTVTWDVANTNVGVVNCQIVDIYLSTDGGFTYPDTLAKAVPNVGSYSVMMPQIVNSSSRLRVQAADNIFFNIGEGFSIVAPTAPNAFGITLTATPNYNDSLVQLNWTDSFSNENYFVIERSLNGNGNFTIIDQVPANTTTYDDSSANMYGENYYRVQAINTAGSSPYSNEASYQGLSVDQIVGQKGFTLFPNPSRDVITVHGAVSEIRSVEVFDASGRRVNLSALESLGQLPLQISVADLPVGNYWMQLIDAKGEVSTLPFTKAN